MTPCKGVRYTDICAIRKGCARYVSWQALCRTKPIRPMASLAMPCHRGDLTMRVEVVK